MKKKTLLLLLFGCIWLKGEIDLCIVCIKVEVIVWRLMMSQRNEVYNSFSIDRDQTNTKSKSLTADLTTSDDNKLLFKYN